MSESQPAPRGARVLTVDDNPTNLKVLLQVLEAGANSVLVATNGIDALKIATQALPDLILLDVVMPGMDGYEVCRRLKENGATESIPVVFLTARDQKEDIIAGFRAGGVDYITKPFQEEEVLARVATHVRLRHLTEELREKNAALVAKNSQLEREMVQRRVLKGQLTMISQREAEKWGLPGFVGQSPTMRRIFREVQLMQENPATSVLITGESGTGKELIARAIHFGGQRREGPFVPVNCAAIPAGLVESALFGHVRGAFTGADEDRAGYFEMANGGTLFLDEIADMPLALQSKLLRVLEDGQVWSLGAKEEKKVDVRALAATNVELQGRIQGGGFRQDLYFRLAHFTVAAPPLRDRREDIRPLCLHFLKMLADEMGRELPSLSKEAARNLEKYDFPGNVRELRNIVERALIESGGGEVLLPQHLHDNFARLLSSTFSGAMKAVVDVDTAFVDQTTYAEFIMSLSNPSCSYQFTLGPTNGQAIIDFAMPLAFAYIDSVFGGVGSPEGIGARTLSQVEIGQMHKLAKRAIEDLEATWEPILRVDITDIELETNPEFMQITAASEIVILHAFKVNTKHASGLVSLCYPFFTIEAILPRLGRRTYGRTGRHDREQLIGQNRARLGPMKLPVRVEMGRTKLSVKEAAQLQVGDVVRMSSRQSDSCVLFVGGEPKYYALPFAEEDGDVRLSVTGKVSKEKAQDYTLL